MESNERNTESSIEKLKQPKEVEEILSEEIESGLRNYERTDFGKFISAFSAGLEIGFSLFIIYILYTIFFVSVSPPVLTVILTCGYPVGYVIVLIGRSELFTEHTTMAMLPVLDGKKKFGGLMKLWLLIYTGNLAGGYLSAIALVYLGMEMQIINDSAIYYFARKLVNHDWLIKMAGGIAAGWLMGLLSWLITSSGETISRIFLIFLITSIIGIGSLYHSIVGSMKVFISLFLDVGGITAMDLFEFQTAATIGNIIGGTVFVALIKFGFKASQNQNN